MIEALIDTGFLYAFYDKGDKSHQKCADVLKQRDQKIYLVSIVLPKALYLVRRGMGYEQGIKVLLSLQVSPFTWLDPLAGDYKRATELMAQY